MNQDLRRESSCGIANFKAKFSKTFPPPYTFSVQTSNRNVNTWESTTNSSKAILLLPFEAFLQMYN